MMNSATFCNIGNPLNRFTAADSPKGRQWKHVVFGQTQGM